MAQWIKKPSSVESISSHWIWCRWSIVLICWNRNVRYWKWILFEISSTWTCRRLSRQSPASLKAGFQIESLLKVSANTRAKVKASVWKPRLNEWRGNSSFSPEKTRQYFGLKFQDWIYWRKNPNNSATCNQIETNNTDSIGSALILGIFLGTYVKSRDLHNINITQMMLRFD